MRVFNRDVFVWCPEFSWKFCELPQRLRHTKWRGVEALEVSRLDKLDYRSREFCRRFVLSFPLAGDDDHNVCPGSDGRVTIVLVTHQSKDFAMSRAFQISRSGRRGVWSVGLGVEVFPVRRIHVRHQFVRSSIGKPRVCHKCRKPRVCHRCRTPRVCHTCRNPGVPVVLSHSAGHVAIGGGMVAPQTRFVNRPTGVTNSSKSRQTKRDHVRASTQGCTWPKVALEKRARVLVN